MHCGGGDVSVDTEVVGGVVAVTCISGVDAEALVPESTQQDEAVVSRDDKTLSIYLDALI